MKHSRMTAASFAVALSPLAGIAASLAGALPARGVDVPFTERVISTSADGAVSVFATDLDGDGDTDVLSASHLGNKIAWYESNGGSPPSFTERVISTNAIQADTVFATDVDGDGDTDVLSASWLDHKIAWYENTSPCQPPPPSAATAEDSGAGGSVNVSWQANAPEDNVTGYRISFGQQSGSLDGAQLVDANVTGYQVTGLQDYVEYFFTVAAINDCGEGDPSEEVSATPTQPSGDYLKALKEVALAVKHLVHARDLGIDYTACIELAVGQAQYGAQNFIAYQEAQYGSSNQHIIKAWEVYHKGVEERTAGRLSKAIKQFRLSRAHADHAE